LPYQINEIPFLGNPTILAINELDIVTHTWGQEENRITAKRNKIEWLLMPETGRLNIPPAT
jgi:hypothetical protein